MTAPFAIETIPVDSIALRRNRADDPSERWLVLLVPPGADRRHPLPVIWLLPGHGSAQGSFLANDPWREGLPQRLGRLTAAGRLAPVIIALPDLFTRYGGAQALDSIATGPYETHLWTELKPLLETYRPVTAHGICGHSSGGYGALVQAMRHPDIIKVAAAHAPDALFEYCYLPDFPKAAARIAAEGGIEKFMAAFAAAPKKQDGRWLTAINIIAMSAAYSPDAAEPLAVALPFDRETGELRPQVWERWLAHDPVRMMGEERHLAALKSLRMLYIDVGARDEFNLQWGARAIVRRLKAQGVRHIYEEFDDGHMGTSYRFDLSLPLLAANLQEAG